VAEGLGLYVHVPYCLKKCSYCAFASQRKPEDISGMCTALFTEFSGRTRGKNLQFDTFYAGGGTPTLLPPEFWARFISTVNSPSLTERTIESNPAVLDARGYSTILLAGFNRISLGVQSFQGEHLKQLGRAHTSEDADEALSLAKRAGFRNVSADLMYGLPGQDMNSFRKDLEKMLGHMPEHLSLYELTLEKGTPMGDRGIKAPDSLCADMYHLAHDLLTENGYIHYEVSNYAREEKYVSRHNSAYWKRTPYIGIGPSAHSFDGHKRSWNHSDSVRYESAVVRGDSPEESSEDLTGENGAHELLALGFRHSGGVDLNSLEKLGFRLAAEELLDTGMVARKANILVPDHHGMLFADSLALKAAELLERLPGFDDR